MKNLPFYWQRSVPFIDLSRYDIDLEHLKVLPKEVMKEYQFVILDRFHKGFTLGMVEPDLRHLVENIFTKQFKERLHLGVYKIHQEHLDPLLNIGEIS